MSRTSLTAFDDTGTYTPGELLLQFPLAKTDRFTFDNFENLNLQVVTNEWLVLTVESAQTSIIESTLVVKELF